LSEWVFVSRADKLAIVSATGEQIAEVDIQPMLRRLSLKACNIKTYRIRKDFLKKF